MLAQFLFLIIFNEFTILMIVNDLQIHSRVIYNLGAKGCTFF